MNNLRRNSIKKAKKLIEEVQSIIEDVKLEEEMAFDNLSEGLQQTMRGEAMENNVEILEEVIEMIEGLLESLDGIE